MGQLGGGEKGVMGADGGGSRKGSSYRLTTAQRPVPLITPLPPPTCGNRGRSSLSNLMQSVSSLRMGLGVSERMRARSGRRRQQPTRNRIWSLELQLE